MGREPRNYSIVAVILRSSAATYQISVRATAVDMAGGASTFVERAECPTRQEAWKKQVEMVREMSARLRLQGNLIVSVHMDPEADPDA